MRTYLSQNSDNAFFALADPNRRQIVELLAKNGQMSSSQIGGFFTISQPAISQHLKVLRESEIVNLEKQAQQRIYHLNLSKINEIELWIKSMNELWHNRFDRLETLLEHSK